jgi:hypothetical protein
MRTVRDLKLVIEEPLKEAIRVPTGDLTRIASRAKYVLVPVALEHNEKDNQAELSCGMWIGVKH